MESDRNETENGEKETIEIPEITTDELQNAIKRLKKGKAADSNGISAEDMKACDEETKEMVRQIFNEIVKQSEFTPEAWRRVRIKVMHKKETWKILETTAQYPPCLRCTNCSRQYCTAGFFQDLTKSKQKIRRGSGGQTEQRNILRRTG